MEHKGVKIAVRIIGILALIEAIVMIDVGIFGLRVFETWSAYGISMVYAMSVLAGLIEAIAAFGLMWIKKWGIFVFCVFTIVSLCTSIVSVLIGLVSIVSTIPSLFITIAAAIYLLYAQKVIFFRALGDSK